MDSNKMEFLKHQQVNKILHNLILNKHKHNKVKHSRHNIHNNIKLIHYNNQTSNYIQLINIY